MNFSRSGDDMVERGTHLSDARNHELACFIKRQNQRLILLAQTAWSRATEPSTAGNILSHSRQVVGFNMSVNIERLVTNGAALSCRAVGLEDLASSERIALAVKQRLLFPLQLFFA